jgi:hypothetical protein
MFRLYSHHQAYSHVAWFIIQIYIVVPDCTHLYQQIFRTAGWTLLRLIVTLNVVHIVVMMIIITINRNKDVVCHN